MLSYRISVSKKNLLELLETTKYIFLGGISVLSAIAPLVMVIIFSSPWPLIIYPIGLIIFVLKTILIIEQTNK